MKVSNINCKLKHLVASLVLCVNIRNIIIYVMTCSVAHRNVTKL